MFSGNADITRSFNSRPGLRCHSVDWDASLHPDLSVDITSLTLAQLDGIFGYVDFIWASPDCATYSKAGRYIHREWKRGNYAPISEYARKCDSCNVSLFENILWPLVARGGHFIVENPVGRYRYMPWVRNLVPCTTYYSCYGADFSQKPTDLFTDVPYLLRPYLYVNRVCHHFSVQSRSHGCLGRSKMPPLLITYIGDFVLSLDYLNPHEPYLCFF